MAFAECKTDPSDRQIRTVWLTPDGRDRIATALARPELVAQSLHDQPLPALAALLTHLVRTTEPEGRP
jgi:hypothetical protein